MPALGNITVKKYDGTTDIVYTGVSPQGGSDQPSRWASQSVGSAQAHQPDLRVMVKDRGNTVEFRGTYAYPELQTNTTTSKTSVLRKLGGSVSLSYDRAMNQTDLNEAVHQFFNLCAAAAIKEIARSGTPAV